MKKKADLINLVYIGRGGYDMQDAVRLLFTAFKNGLQVNEGFRKFRFHFIGTSYAPHGQGKPTILPIAEELAVNEFVNEQTDRISFYQNIHSLLQADALVVPGSNDPQYTASKIYPYILAKKPLLAIFNPDSSAAEIIRNCAAGHVVNLTDPAKATQEIERFLLNLVNDTSYKNETDWVAFEEYSAKNMTRKQCELFEQVLSKRTD